MSAASFIAQRLHRHANKGSLRISGSVMTIASAGVAVGVAIMLVTIGVAFGFKAEIRSKVLGMQGHIQVFNHRSLLSQESYPVLIDDSVMEAVFSVPDVQRACRFVSKAGMLKSPTGFQGLQFIGHEEGDSCFAVSQMMADALQMQKGDKVNAYFFEKSIRARRLAVDSIFATNMEQFDRHMALGGYDMVHRLTGWKAEECSGLRIFTDGKRSTRDVAYDISRALLPYSLDREMVVVTAEELSPQVFSWLSLLDTNVWIILALMLCVASFTMVSGLLILILERTSFVALMKSIGATNSTIRSVFIHLSTMLLLKAMLWGNAMALVLMLIQDKLHIVSLNPSDYYIDTVPVQFAWAWFAAVDAGTLVVSVAALLLPAMFVSHIRPAAVMRVE